MFTGMARPTLHLARSEIFQVRPEALAIADRIKLTYARAKAIAHAYSLTASDILELSPKFWQLHADPICSMDGAAYTLVTLQYNCCGGTLAMFSRNRPDILPVLQQVLSFQISGQFCLTEVGHGLDVIHLETTATLLPTGEYELNTPNDAAAKFMPPTAPAGMRCVAIVFARAIMEGEDRGVKPFLVPINDGYDMCEGVECRLLPQRGGSRPINHSLTYFHKVRLPSTALLGTDAKPVDARTAFFANISRVLVGTIALGSLGVPTLQVASFIAARYSMRRTVTDVHGTIIPIMSFRTQKTPIVTALAQSFVMQAWHEDCVQIFSDPSVDPRVRHGIAATMKIVMIELAQAAHLSLSERCGAQGLFEVNQISAVHADLRGSGIAEGDLLALSIRLASELLLGRYSLPATSRPEELLPKHELSLFAELKDASASLKHHRSADFDRLILPHCFALVQAIGHRMAWEAAVKKGVDPAILDVYVSSIVSLDSAWYAEKGGLGRRAQAEREATAIDVLYPQMDVLLAKIGVEAYVTAPIISDELWLKYTRSLKTYTSHGQDNARKLARL